MYLEQTVAALFVLDEITDEASSLDRLIADRDLLRLDFCNADLFRLFPKKLVMALFIILPASLHGYEWNRNSRIFHKIRRQNMSMLSIATNSAVRSCYKDCTKNVYDATNVKARIYLYSISATKMRPYLNV